MKFMLRLVLLSLSLLSVSLGAEEWPAAPRGILTTTNDTELSTSGRFTGQGFEVAFAANETGEGALTLQVGVGSAILDASRDPSTGVIWMDGQKAALKKGDVLALYGLLVTLTDAWKSEINSGQLSPHRDLLLRHLSYWAEAPVGLPLGYLETKIDPAKEAQVEGFLASRNSAAPSAVSCVAFTSTCPVNSGNCVVNSYNTPCKTGTCGSGKTCFRCDNKLIYFSGCTYTSRQ